MAPLIMACISTTFLGTLVLVWAVWYLEGALAQDSTKANNVVTFLVAVAMVTILVMIIICLVSWLTVAGVK